MAEIVILLAIENIGTALEASANDEFAERNGKFTSKP